MSIAASHCEIELFKTPTPWPHISISWNKRESPVVFPMSSIAPPRRLGAIDEMCQRQTITLGWNCNFHHFTQGRHDVDIFCEFINHSSMHTCMTWVSNNSNDVLTCFPIANFFAQAMITQQLGVIVSDDNYCVIPLTRFH